MKTLLAYATACAILMACDAGDPVRSTTPPTPPPDVAPVPYVMTGMVRDENGLPLAGARAEILGGNNRAYWGRSATANDLGVFRFEGVRGDLWVQVGKAGYHADLRTYIVSSDIRIDVVLVSAILPGAPMSDTIQLGKTIRSVTNQPPCDPSRWDARAPCRRLDFMSESPGHLDITVSWVGLSMDATFVTRFSDLYIDTSQDTAVGEVTLSMDVAAYTHYEVRVNSYYEQQEFNLRAEFVPLRP